MTKLTRVYKDPEVTSVEELKLVRHLAQTLVDALTDLPQGADVHSLLHMVRDLDHAITKSYLTEIA